MQLPVAGRKGGDISLRKLGSVMGMKLQHPGGRWKGQTEWWEDLFPLCLLKRPHGRFAYIVSACSS